MARLLILGAGTAGTMLANRMRRALDDSWHVTVVDRDDAHHYQPGYLFIPFGTSSPTRVIRPRSDSLAPGVEWIQADIDRVDPDARRVWVRPPSASPDPTHAPPPPPHLDYDWLVIATGTTPRPDRTPGMADGPLWRDTIHEFYTLAGAGALERALSTFTSGRLVVHVSEMPIKCPVAPLEFALLADAHFRRRGIRHLIDITYATPLDGAFTKPVASRHLGSLLEQRAIRVAPDFAIDHIDNSDPALVSFDGRRIPFDLLVTVPVNMGAQFVIDSGLGDELGFVPVDKHTLRSPTHPRIFALGDAANLPTSKAGAVAHFAAHTLETNLLAAMGGAEPTASFDGHANCFVESGFGEALLLDFSYDTEPLTGHFPTPAGPFRLLGRSHLNHLGKLAFEQLYWDVLLPGHPLPVPTKMSMLGKKRED